MSNDQSPLERLGCFVSERVAGVAAHPFAQVGFFLGCLAWFAAGWRIDLLTAGLSILAITLTQMVLNRQEAREREAHRRDLALHTKLDELLIASKRARDELAGIEELEEEQIEELKHPAAAALIPLRRAASGGRRR